MVWQKLCMWQMVTRLMILWCIEILRHYVVHPELTQCCRSIMLLLLFSQSVVSNSSRHHGSTPGFPVLDHLPEVAQIQPSLVLCHPLLLPSIFPSIRVFSNESALHIRCPKYWNFTFNISPPHEHSGLISFRMDWLDLLAVQGTHSQESFPTWQFKSINSSALSILYSPTLTSIHDYWKNHSFD